MTVFSVIIGQSLTDQTRNHSAPFYAVQKAGRGTYFSGTFLGIDRKIMPLQFLQSCGYNLALVD